MTMTLREDPLEAGAFRAQRYPLRRWRSIGPSTVHSAQRHQRPQRLLRPALAPPSACSPQRPQQGVRVDSHPIFDPYALPGRVAGAVGVSRRRWADAGQAVGVSRRGPTLGRRWADAWPTLGTVAGAASREEAATPTIQRHHRLLPAGRAGRFPPHFRPIRPARTCCGGGGGEQAAVGRRWAGGGGEQAAVGRRWEWAAQAAAA